MSPGDILPYPVGQPPLGQDVPGGILRGGQPALLHQIWLARLFFTVRTGNRGGNFMNLNSSQLEVEVYPFPHPHTRLSTPCNVMYNRHFQLHVLVMFAWKAKQEFT